MTNAAGTAARPITLRDVLVACGFALIFIDQVAASSTLNLHSWVQLFGQLGYPLLFFMVGYERSRDIPLVWLAGGVIITLVNFLTGGSLLPVSVLLTLAVSRFLVPYVWAIAWRRSYYFWYVLLLLFFAGYIARWAFEFGTLGILFMLAGDATRRRAEVDGRLGKRAISVMIALVFVGTLMLQALILGLNVLQILLFAGGLAGIWWVVTQNDLSRPVRVAPVLVTPVMYAVWFYIAAAVVFRCGLAVAARLSYILASA